MALQNFSLIQTFIFIDEVKTSISGGGLDNSFYYFAVSCPKGKVVSVERKFKALYTPFSKRFHAIELYKAKNINYALLDGITNLIIEERLLCHCFRYDKDRFFEATKKFLNTIGNEEFRKRSSNWEFQALFYFVQTLDEYLNANQTVLETPACLFFDRNIYGLKNDEDIDIHSVHIGRAAFTSGNKIRLLGLADHFGYLFHQSRKMYNLTGQGIVGMKGNVFGEALLKITNAGLFRFLDIDNWMKENEVKVP